MSSAEGQALFEDRARFVRTTQPRQGHAEAVQDDGLVAAVALAANQRQRRLVVSQRLGVSAPLPLEDAEHVANRRFSSPFADRRRECERRLERRDRVCRSVGAQRARQAFARLQFASGIAQPRCSARTTFHACAASRGAVRSRIRATPVHISASDTRSSSCANNSAASRRYGNASSYRARPSSALPSIRSDCTRPSAWRARRLRSTAAR